MTAVTPGTTAAGTMTAIVQDEYGTAPEAVLRLAGIATPAIADDEILVRVRATSVDRGTWHLMAGLPYPIRLAGFGLRRPKAPNPGRSLAGTVESAGPKATQFVPGDEVYGTCDGSFAPYARAQAGRLAPKPANLSFVQAAAVPVSALTALQAVRDQARVQPGQKVLIVGASGGVGTFAVQIAKAFGAEVTGVCSTAKTDLVRSIGADRVIDYTREDFADGQHRYDVILDIGGGNGLSHLRRALTRRVQPVRAISASRRSFVDSAEESTNGVSSDGGTAAAGAAAEGQGLVAAADRAAGRLLAPGGRADRPGCFAAPGPAAPVGSRARPAAVV